MSETANPTVSDVVNDAEALATAAGATISQTTDTVLDNTASVVGIAATVAAKEFNIDLDNVLKGLAYLFLGATALVTVFRRKTSTTAS